MARTFHSGVHCALAAAALSGASTPFAKHKQAPASGAHARHFADSGD
jgi:hypothetical protein